MLSQTIDAPKNLPTSHVMNMVTVADGIYQMNLDLCLIAVISHTLGFPFTINMSATSEPQSINCDFFPHKVLTANKYGGFYYEMIITGRNEVVAKVIFLHLSVILFTEGTPPPQSRHPPGADTPQEQTPSRSRHPPREAHSSIRSTSGRYAFYWNAFLLAYVIRISRYPHMDEQRSDDSIIFWLALSLVVIPPEIISLIVDFFTIT